MNTSSGSINNLSDGNSNNNSNTNTLPPSYRSQQSQNNSSSSDPTVEPQTTFIGGHNEIICSDESSPITQPSIIKIDDEQPNIQRNISEKTSSNSNLVTIVTISGAIESQPPLKMTQDGPFAHI